MSGDCLMQDVVHAPPNVGGACLEEVEGFTSVSAMKSLVTIPPCPASLASSWTSYGSLSNRLRRHRRSSRSGQCDHHSPRPNPGLGNSSFYRPPPVCGDRLALHRLL